MPSSCLMQVRQGRQFRADRLRNTPPLPATSSPNTLPKTLTPPASLTSFHLPWGQALPPPRLHLLSADFPAHCPLTFNLNNIPPPSAQTGIRIQPRNLKMYSGGDVRWLRCSFECFIYFFFYSFWFYTTLPLCSAKLSLFIEMRRCFFYFVSYACFVATVKTDLLWLASHKHTHLWCLPEVFVRMWDLVNLWGKAHFHNNIMNV